MSVRRGEVNVIMHCDDLRGGGGDEDDVLM